ncbi:hypothetical protein [Cytobacillus sp. Bac17]|uniref:hypothetical protein n=1 Tax=Cytobacillus sp. Bac17 TaxID=2926008 RepID=UPI0021199E19|nr:hypothetical protein [Cytobacillus sp. Bac17]
MAPTQTPINKDKMVCLVNKAIPIATNGGKSDKAPNSINVPPFIRLIDKRVHPRLVNLVGLRSHIAPLYNTENSKISIYT